MSASYYIGQGGRGRAQPARPTVLSYLPRSLRFSLPVLNIVPLHTLYLPSRPSPVLYFIVGPLVLNSNLDMSLDARPNCRRYLISFPAMIGCAHRFGDAGYASRGIDACMYRVVLIEFHLGQAPELPLKLFPPILFTSTVRPSPL